MATFWIQLHGLPMAGMNKSNICAIGASIGTIVDMDLRPDGITFKQFFRIKVSFNASSLKHGFSLPRPKYPLFGFVMKNCRIFATNVVVWAMWLCFAPVKLLGIRNTISGHWLGQILRIMFPLRRPLLIPWHLRGLQTTNPPPHYSWEQL